MDEEERAVWRTTTNDARGRVRAQALNVVIAGDDVEFKKPDPQIYNVARERLGGLDALNCVVIEVLSVGASHRIRSSRIDAGGVAHPRSSF